MRRPLPMIVTLLLLASSLPMGHAQAAPVRVAAGHRTNVSRNAASEKAPLLDLNSASKAELGKLPGVGEAIAGKIIAGRPWKSKYDLVIKKVVTRNVYDKFAKLVVARQPEGS